MDIKIIRNDWLPAQTIMMSKDLWEAFEKEYGEKERDEMFMQSLGIETKGEA